MARIGIIGSGNVGANTAFFAAERNIAPVRMYDIKEGLAIGKALDMMEAAPVRGYQFPIDGTDDLSDAMDADVIIVAAGAVREPGMKRTGLFAANRAVIETIGTELAGFAGVAIVATEPVDALVPVFSRAAGMPWQRVLGIGGALDSLRLRYLVARELGVDADGVAATVIGAHADDMLPLPRYTSVSGVPIASLLSEQRIAALFGELRSAGDTILEFFKRSTSFYGPAAAAVDLTEAVVRDAKRVLSVSFLLTGQYGVSDVALSLPAVIGRGGIERVLEPKLSDDELGRFKASAESLAGIR